MTDQEKRMLVEATYEKRFKKLVKRLDKLFNAVERLLNGLDHTASEAQSRIQDCEREVNFASDMMDEVVGTINDDLLPLIYEFDPEEEK
jgi:hypothetical protein